MNHQAISVFEKVEEQAPEEPHSQLDLGLSKFLAVRQKKPIDCELLSDAIQHIVNVLRGTEWPSRFVAIPFSSFSLEEKINQLNGTCHDVQGPDIDQA